MGTFIEQFWQGYEGYGFTSADKRSGAFLAYVPDPLELNIPSIGERAMSIASDALVTLGRADERIGSNGRYFNHLLIRSESIASSWIEGNVIAPKKLAIAELLKLGTHPALEVIANIRATEEAIELLGDPHRPITVQDIETLQHTVAPELPYGIRQEQNWVGGSGNSPLRAAFIPPPASEVPRLLDNLAQFVTNTTGNPIVRAAIAHAQFETIHPFIDGNGRTGRALIHTVLKRSHALQNTLIPISTVFAGNTGNYITGLIMFRNNPPELDQWIIDFATATEIAATNAVELVDNLQTLNSQVHEELVSYRQAQGMIPAIPREDAVSGKIINALADTPVITAAIAAQQYSVAIPTAQRALVMLTDAGILNRSRDHKSNTVFYTADRHLALITLTERSNRVGGVDTAIHPPPKTAPALPDREHVGELPKHLR